MNQGYKCPKCPGFMQTYSRAGVHIEQCGQCRGIFLDYGEIETIGRAETAYAPPPPPPPAQQGYTPQPAYQQPAYQQPAYGQPAYGQPAYGHHRQKSFMHALFST